MLERSVDSFLSISLIRESFNGARETFYGIRDVFNCVRESFYCVREVYFCVRKIFHGIRELNFRKSESLRKATQSNVFVKVKAPLIFQ